MADQKLKTYQITVSEDQYIILLNMLTTLRENAPDLNTIEDFEGMGTVGEHLQEGTEVLGVMLAQVKY